MKHNNSQVIYQKRKKITKPENYETIALNYII